MTAAQARALALYRRSVLKQQKFRHVVALLGDVQGRACLDIGARDGALGLMLRRRGGSWRSADTGPAVAAVRAVVGEEAYALDGWRLPFGDGAFEVVVVLDYFEHVEDDAAFARELARVCRPGGILVAHVPHVVPGSRLRWLRARLGLTDERHGHVRPGYTLAGLAALLGPDFAVEASRAYSRVFSQLLDIAVHAVQDRLRAAADGAVGGRAGARGVRAGRAVPGFRAFGAAYPLLRLVAVLDVLLVGLPGHFLVVRARRVAGPGA